MFFSVLKSVFWIVVIVVLFPVNETQHYRQFTNNTQGHLTPEHLYALTKETVDDVDTFCTRNQATCKNFQGMITEFGGKIKYIGDSIFDWAKGIGNTGNTQIGEVDSPSDEVKTPEKSQYYEFEDTIQHRKTSNLYPRSEKSKNVLAWNNDDLNDSKSRDNKITTASVKKRSKKVVVKEKVTLVNTFFDKKKNITVNKDTLTKEDKEFPWQSFKKSV